MVYLVELSDKRNIILLELLKDKCCPDSQAFSFDNADKFADASGTVVFSPARKLTADEVKVLPQACNIVGGAQSEEILFLLKDRGISYTNMLTDENMAIKNAKLTAEGALSLIISNTEKSIYQNNILILGLGRVGKAVALMLDKLGVKTSVTSFDMAEIDAYSLYADKAYFGYEFLRSIQDYDVIINTIPKKIFDDDALGKISENAAIIELASVSCLDKESAIKFPFKYIPAPALPMKYCAKSAAEIILECVCSKIK